MSPRQRSKSLNALYRHLSSAPPNVASLKFDPLSGAFEATFRAAVAEIAAAGEDTPAEKEPEDFRFALERFSQPMKRQGA